MADRKWGDLYTEKGQLTKYFPLHEGQADILASKARFLAAIAGTGGGKCFGKDTPILMYDGSIKMVQDVKVGDMLMGNDSTPRRVLSLAHGISQLYRVSQSGIRAKGYVAPFTGEYIVNDDHILSLKRTAKTIDRSSRDTDIRYSNHPSRMGDTDIFNISVLDYLRESPRFRQSMKGHRTGVDYPEHSVKLDPYFLGVWLGDGTSRCAAVTTADKEIVQAIDREATARNLKVRQDGITYHLAPRNGVRSSKGQFVGSNPLLNDLREYNLVLNKHIPAEYLANSREVRLQLLAGLIDTDGDYCHGFAFTNKNYRLACDTLRLARSLGFAANIAETKKKSQNGTWGIYYRVTINGDLPTIPTRIPHKQANPRRINKDPLVYGIKVTPIGQGEYFGFEIDGNRLFLLGDYTVVHNTVCGALWLMMECQKKPLGKFLLIAPTYKTLRSSTLPAWRSTVEGTDLEGDYKVADSEYLLPTGGKIYIRSAEDPRSLQGVVASAAWIDEGGMVSKEAWTTTCQRVGFQQGRVLVTSTPYAHNWFYSDFYQRFKQGDKNYFVRTFPSIANPCYPREEYERAKATLPPHTFSMLYDGVFKRAAGQVYDFSTCIVPVPKSLPFGRLVGGIDFGFNDPFAALAGILDQDDVLWLSFERYVREKTLAEHAPHLPKNVSWWADSSRPDSIKDLRRCGHAVRPCRKGSGSIERGINLVVQRIRAGKLKIVEGTCPNLLAESELYRYPDQNEQVNGDIPIDEHSHAMDALRYLVAAVDHRKVISV